MIRAFALLAALGLAAPAQAEYRYADGDAKQAYVESNLLGILYHELGHALIDILDLPIFGQEEDAADVLSVFLLDAFYDEQDAVQLAYDTAFGFLGEVDQRGEREPAYWDVHGPDLQRYYNLVCIFYGADPEAREDVAQELGLPEDRAEYCDFEYDQAAGSWGAVLDEIAHDTGNGSFQLGDVDVTTDGGDLTLLIVETEIEALNEEFRLPVPLTISVVPCGMANAFYDPEYREIVMCTEFADDLAKWAPL
ncbi:MAG: DUF4344 domain-containing metallopeptidase [Paracoccaceae bacterium]